MCRNFLGYLKLMMLEKGREVGGEWRVEGEEQ